MRAGSVFTELPGKEKTEPAVIQVTIESDLPENLRAALDTAKELFTSVDGKAIDRMSTLHALYMQIRFGDYDGATEETKSALPRDVAVMWSTLHGVSRESLYFKFAAELASQNV